MKFGRRLEEALPASLAPYALPYAVRARRGGAAGRPLAAPACVGCLRRRFAFRVLRAARARARAPPRIAPHARRRAGRARAAAARRRRASRTARGGARAAPPPFLRRSPHAARRRRTPPPCACAAAARPRALLCPHAHARTAARAARTNATARAADAPPAHVRARVVRRSSLFSARRRPSRLALARLPSPQDLKQAIKEQVRAAGSGGFLDSTDSSGMAESGAEAGGSTGGDEGSVLRNDPWPQSSLGAAAAFAQRLRGARPRHRAPRRAAWSGGARGRRHARARGAQAARVGPADTTHAAR
jgi:hypothetical protein